jgi:Outer membrane lipoprotein-sorting protein
LLFGLVAWGLPVAFGQPKGFRPPPNYVSTGKPDQAEGARILGEFHEAGIAGTYWLGFELRVLPRQGAERAIKGEMWGTRGENGPLTRLSIAGQSWLIKGGPQAAAWTAAQSGPSVELPAGKTLDPLAGTDLTLFDLQMPFFYWTDFVYEGLTRVRGRPSHSFVLYPPPEFVSARPGLTGVRVLLDTQFEALVQAEVLGPAGATEKTISILDLKKIGNQWVPKSIDIRNNLTRDKTRLDFQSAALNLTLPPEVFNAAALAAQPPAIPADKIQAL